MSDNRFDYARKKITDGVESAAASIVWLVAVETGKHVGSDAASIRAREDLQVAVESFLRQ